MNVLRRRGKSRPLGASTLGTPGESLATVLAYLRDAGASHLELRVGPSLELNVHSPADARNAVRAQVGDAGIILFAIASQVRAAADAPDAVVVEDIAAHLQLAADIGASFVRIFPGAPLVPGPLDRLPTLVNEPRDIDERIVRRLLEIAELAVDLGVRPVLEVHDSHPRGEDLARVLLALETRRPDHPVGVIWDVLHPFRVGEAPAETARFLAPYLLAGRGYVQIKDVASRAVLTPVRTGQGIVPLGEIFDLLDRLQYAGPVSLEWERVWYPQIESLPAPLQTTADWLASRHPMIPGGI
jgi:sugar phosphate isomerase/epimerase